MAEESKFNWKTLFGDKLKNKTTEVDTNDVIDGVDAVGIYFGSKSEIDCVKFNAKFGEAYNALKEAGKKFEAVFVSIDECESVFEEHHGVMPWLAVPFREQAKKDDLMDKYEVPGFPYLVILDGKDGSTITLEGRHIMTGPNVMEDFPYKPKACYDVKDNMKGIKKGVCLLLVQNYADEAIIKKNSDMLMKFATENQGLFHKYFTVNGGGACPFIREQCDMVNIAQHPDPVEKQEINPITAELKEPVLIIMDFPNSNYYRALNPVVNEDSIKVLAADFKKGDLKAITLKSKR